MEVLCADVTVFVKWTASKRRAEGRWSLKPSGWSPSRKCFEFGLLFVLLPEVSFYPLFCSVGVYSEYFLTMFSSRYSWYLHHGSCVKKKSWILNRSNVFFCAPPPPNPVYRLLSTPVTSGFALESSLPPWPISFLLSSADLVFVFSGNILHADCVTCTFPWILMCVFSQGLLWWKTIADVQQALAGRLLSLIQLETISC